MVAADGTIYESASDGVLHALDPATGADKWTFNGGGSLANNQDLSTSAAIFGDGTIVWPGPNTIVASYPAMTANGTLVIGSDNGTLYAFHG